MLSRKYPDSSHAGFDDHLLVANAWLMLPNNPVLRLGLCEPATGAPR